MYSARNSITVDSTEEQRYEVLKNLGVRYAAVNYDLLGEVGDLGTELNGTQTSKARKSLLTFVRKLGINQVNLKNSRIEFLFNFSNRNADVSIHHQEQYGGSYQDLAKAFTCLPELVDGAELIETHTEKKTGTKKENPDLKQVYVLLGAMKDGEYIIPVQMEVKEHYTAENSLYMTVALTKIEESDVVGTASAGKTAATPSLLSDSEVSIQKIFENVNIQDARFLKYVPDGFLNAEQKTAKQEALRKQGAEYAGFTVSGDGKVSYSLRNTEGVSNRSLLANALESAAQNDIERKKLTEYKGKIEAMLNAEKRRSRAS